VQQAIYGKMKNPFDQVVYQSILGTQSFVESVKKRLPRKGKREIPSLNRRFEQIKEQVINMSNLKI
jgi:hypothetical protein